MSFSSLLFSCKWSYISSFPHLFQSTASGGSNDWTYASLNVVHSYVVELRDTVCALWISFSPFCKSTFLNLWYAHFLRHSEINRAATASFCLPIKFCPPVQRRLPAWRPPCSIFWIIEVLFVCLPQNYRYLLLPVCTCEIFLFNETISFAIKEADILW